MSPSLFLGSGTLNLPSLWHFIGVTGLLVVFVPSLSLLHFSLQLTLHPRLLATSHLGLGFVNRSIPVLSWLDRYLLVLILHSVNSSSLIWKICEATLTFSGDLLKGLGTPFSSGEVSKRRCGPHGS